MSQATKRPHAILAGERAKRFHADTFVFDALSISYVLEEKYAERCLAGGVNAATVPTDAGPDMPFAAPADCGSFWAGNGNS